MSNQSLELDAKDFIATCRALKAASAGSHRYVELRFEPRSLTIEGEMGGGVLRTTGDFQAQVRVPYALLAKVASLHRAAAKINPWVKCTLDDELGEIRFPQGGLKAKFAQ